MRKHTSSQSLTNELTIKLLSALVLYNRYSFNNMEKME